MLQACLNGSRPVDAHPALPTIPRHLARDAKAVAKYGVTAVHIHPRDTGGLETLDPRQGRVVELRFFGGLTYEEAAHVLNVSVGTVRRDWSLAQAWLYRELNRRAPL